MPRVQDEKAQGRNLRKWLQVDGFTCNDQWPKMAVVGGELVEIKGEKEKPTTKVDIEKVGGCSTMRMKNVVAGREHVRWSELLAERKTKKKREKCFKHRRNKVVAAVGA